MTTNEALITHQGAGKISSQMNPSKRPTIRLAAGLPRLLALALPAALVLNLSGCTELTRMLARAEPQPAPEPQVVEQPDPTPAPIPEPQEKPKPGKLYEWDGDGRQVTHIVVDTNEQKARFYHGDAQIGWTTVASGVSKHPTPVGEFEVLEKVQNKRSNLYGKIYSKGGSVVRASAKAGTHAVPAGGRFEGARMPYFMRLTYDGIGLHAGPIPRPGRPASHGCIRMPSKMAPILFKHVGMGTRVSIVGKGPDYGNYAARARAEAAERAAIAAREREARERAEAAGVPQTEVASATAAATATKTVQQPRPRAVHHRAAASPTPAPSSPPAKVESPPRVAAASGAPADHDTAQGPTPLNDGAGAEPAAPMAPEPTPAAQSANSAAVDQGVAMPDTQTQPSVEPPAVTPAAAPTPPAAVATTPTPDIPPLPAAVSSPSPMPPLPVAPVQPTRVDPPAPPQASQAPQAAPSTTVASSVDASGDTAATADQDSSSAN